MDKSNVYYMVLNTPNNKKRGLEFHHTTVKPDEGVDFKTMFVTPLGTSYDVRTPDTVVAILEGAIVIKNRFIFDFGDAETGKSYGEVNDIVGYVGRSNGRYRVPILIYRYYKDQTDHWGGTINDVSIVKITTSKGKYVMYQHPNYQAAE